MLRRAAMDDISGIISLGCTFYYASEYAKRFGAFTTYDAELELAKYIGDVNDSLVLVDQNKAILDGFMVATTMRMPFASKCYATDLAFVARRGHGLPILRRMLSWANDRALPVMLGNGFGDERTDKLYSKLGLKRVGGIHMG